MEHRLVTGGEQFLPFARSRIKALRATGLAYASQQFEIDGCSVKVRIAGEHEYIKLDGGLETLLMDSGVVDLGYLYLAPYADCAIASTDYKTAYDASFSTAKSFASKVLGIAATWRVNPSKLSAGQFSGDVYKGPAFAGRLPPPADPARSFCAQWKLPDNPDAPKVRARDSKDDMLLKKKYNATECPPSIFTGKCRLYIQAMYGQHLYDYTKLDAAGNPTACYLPTATSDIAGGTAPYLTVKSHTAPGDTTGYPDIVISTSSGVHLDTATGRHWLISFDGGGSSLSFYPLVGKHERLRWLLKKTDKVVKDAIGAIDLGHLEAYILASCLPDARRKQTVAMGELPHAWSLGYGWHWNWSGTVADIVNIGAKVINEGLAASDTFAGEYYMNSSSHSRLTVTPETVDGVTTWAAALSVVQPETLWNLYRYYWTLLEPNWAEGGFSKTTLPVRAIRAQIVDADFPVYAFYKGDVLQTARFKVTTSRPPPDEFTYTSTPAAIGPGGSSTPAPYPPLDMWSFGLDSTFMEFKGGASNNVDGGRIVTVEFSCGGYSAPVAVFNVSKLGWRADSTQKAITGDRDAGTLRVSGGRTVYYPGDPLVPPAVTISGVLVGMNYSINRYTLHDFTHSESTYVIPRGDAEAIYLRGKTTNIRELTPIDARAMSSASFATWEQQCEVTMVKESTTYWEDGSIRFETWGYTYVVPPQSGADLQTRAAWTYTAPTNSTISIFVPEAITTVSVLDEYAQLLCGGVNSSIIFPEMPEANSELIEDVGAYAFEARSGVATSPPVIFAPGRMPPSGIAGSTDIPAIIGWA